MNTNKSRILMFHVVAVLLLTGHVTFGQQFVPGDFFIDDFEDGDARDSDPAFWQRGRYGPFYELNLFW